MNQLSKSTQISYIYRELDMKNKQIADLRKRMAEILDEKQQLRIELENLKQKFYYINIQCEQETNKICFASKKVENDLQLKIQNLLKENQRLNDIINKENKIEENFKSTIGYKLQKAEEEKQTLSELNATKDNIIQRMEKFYNKLCCILNLKDIKINLVSSNLEAYNKSLDEIEENAIKGIQFVQIEPTKYKNECVNEDKKEKSGQVSLMSNNKSKEGKKNFQRKNEKKKQPWKKEEAKSVYNRTIMRTPPRDYDYISPQSKEMQYLRTVNKINSYSRIEY